MRSSMRLVVTSNMQTHVRLSFQERNAIWSRPETVNLLESFDMEASGFGEVVQRLDVKTRMVFQLERH